MTALWLAGGAEYGCGVSRRHVPGEGTLMITGALIMESLRADARLDDLKLVVREIHRFRPQVTAPEHPDTWSVLEFEADEADAGKLAQALADVLTQPGWYVEFANAVVPGSLAEPLDPDDEHEVIRRVDQERDESLAVLAEM